MTDETIETEVLVVGGGPVGLALAVELGTQRRRCVVVDAGDRHGAAPRAKTTNVRTRELMRRWGIAGRLAQAAPFGVDHPSNVVFATRLAGRELARFANAFWCSPVRDERFAEHAQWVPQYKVEAVLRGRAAELDGVALRDGVRLDDWRETAGGGVEARLTDLAHGRALTVRATYLVGADGARSTVRERLGIRMDGTSPLSHNHNIVFRAPGLAARHGLGPGIMYWLVNDDVPCVVTPLDVGDLWTFGCRRLAAADADPAALIRRALNVDVPIEILSRDEWTAHRLIATAYRRGPVFLAGDACHLHPPFGGHGMNMGIGDAVDLGWKLAARLRGWGGEALLDSYEAERRPVHRRVVDESVDNHAHTSGSLALDGLESDGPAGDAARAAAAAQILATKRREFDSLGIVIGLRYGASPVLADEPGAGDGGGPAPGAGDATVYVPSAAPGARAPHAWLREGRDPGASLYDHFAVDAMTLLVTRDAARAEADAAAGLAADAGVPLRVVAPAAPALRELYGADLALIRPDQHVAWRGERVTAATLTRAAGR